MRSLYAVLVILGARAALAAVPGKMNYQGYLTDDAGAPLTEAYDITFSIHDSVTGGGELWSEAHAAVSVSEGLFSVMLGGTNPLDASVFAGEAWLQLEVDGETMSPRVRVVSVGYSFVAAVSHKAAADSVDTAAIKDGSITDADVSATAAIDASKLAQMGAGDGQVLKWSDADSTWKPGADAGGTCAWTVSGSDVYRSTGNVGIGTASPLYPLDVACSGAASIRVNETTNGIDTRLGCTNVRGYVGTFSAHDFSIMENGNPMLYIKGGNVGIGTITPGAKLDVQYDNMNPDVAAIAIDNLTGSQDVLDFRFGGATQARIRKADGGDFFISTETNNGIQLWTNAKLSLRVTNLGSVGVGDPSPEATFDVEGTVVSSRAARFGAGSSGAPSLYNAFGTGNASHVAATEVGDSNDLFVTDDLEVDGTLFADGDVSVSGNIAFSTGSEKTRYLTIDHTAFKPRFSSMEWSGDPGDGLKSISGPFGYGVYLAPVFLPHNALVTELSAQLHDNTASGFVSAYLQRISFDSTRGGGTMAQVSTGSENASWQILADGSVLNPAIDNVNFLYYVYVRFEIHSPDLKLGGVRIKYIITEPLP